MLKNKIARRLALLFSIILLLTSTVNTTYGFIVTKTDSMINTFTPFETVVNDLFVRKTVEHPFGVEYVIPENVSFDFKVDFGHLYANTALKTTLGTTVADETGSIQIAVKPNDVFCVEDVDAGTRVSVTEIQKQGSGFAVKDNAVTMEGIVDENGSLTFDYVNIYTPQSAPPTDVLVRGTKILEGREWKNEDVFSFLLEQKNGLGEWQSIGIKTIAYDPQNADFNQFDFCDLMQSISFEKIGLYSFRITEIIGDLENVDYDKSINTFTIKVTDVDMDGKLEINSVSSFQNAKVTEENGKFAVDVTFNNTFVPNVLVPDDIFVDVLVDSTLINPDGKTLEQDGFEFILENVQSGEKVSLKSDKNGNAAISLPFTAEDVGKVITYKISQVIGGFDGVAYDSKAYNITISVSLSLENSLIISATIDGEAVDTVLVNFENHCIPQEEPQSPPTRDNSRAGLWLSLMFISAGLFFVLLVLEKKYTKTK